MALKYVGHPSTQGGKLELYGIWTTSRSRYDWRRYGPPNHQLNMTREEALEWSKSCATVIKAERDDKHRPKYYDRNQVGETAGLFKDKDV